MPKRKIEECDLSSTEGSSQSNTSEYFSEENSLSGPVRKKAKKAVNFEKVQVYYFPRAQGFTSVPTQGGTTLGMTERHALEEQYTFKDYRKLRKLVRRKKADVEETPENSFNIDSINEISQEEIVQTDSEEDDTETDGFFLQPVSTKLRRVLLKHSGVKQLDNSERDECKALRDSRETCGCDCQNECLPETCLCALNHIQCQVDRFSFPCGCTQNGCKNPAGRVEFNPVKVRKHYQHTLGRLKQENETITSTPDSKKLGYYDLQKPRHIRFTEDGEALEGEKSFNSTDTGCCFDCSLTSVNSQFCKDSLSDAVQSSVNSGNPSLKSMFGSYSNDFPPPPSQSPIPTRGYSNTAQLEPISGLLNPILNTTDSLDMYSLLHIPHTTPSDGGVYSEDSQFEWHTLPHESLLTTNNLIPLKDEDYSCSSASSSAEQEIGAFQLQTNPHETDSKPLIISVLD